MAQFNCEHTNDITSIERSMKMDINCGWKCCTLWLSVPEVEHKYNTTCHYSSFLSLHSIYIHPSIFTHIQFQPSVILLTSTILRVVLWIKLNRTQFLTYKHESATFAIRKRKTDDRIDEKLESEGHNIIFVLCTQRFVGPSSVNVSAVLSRFNIFMLFCVFFFLC